MRAAGAFTGETASLGRMLALEPQDLGRDLDTRQGAYTWFPPPLEERKRVSQDLPRGSGRSPLHHLERANHCRSFSLPWVTTNCSSVRHGLICVGVAVSEGVAGPDGGGAEPGGGGDAVPAS
jgi:hypothetical protein